MDDQTYPKKPAEKSVAPPLGLEVTDQTELKLQITWKDYPALILFWSLMLIVFLQFFTRYVLNDSLGWTEEIARFLLVLVGFVGSVTAVRKGGHIFLEFIYRFVPRSVAKILSVSAELISFIFYLICTWLSVEIALQSNQTLVSIELSKSYIYWIVAVSFSVMSLYSFRWLLFKLRQNSDSLLVNIDVQAASN